MWNYRIVRHHEPNEWFGLHEVFYDEQGAPQSRTAEPIGFDCSSEEGAGQIIKDLSAALADARNLPVLDAFDFPSYRQDMGGREDR